MVRRDWDGRKQREIWRPAIRYSSAIIYEYAERLEARAVFFLVAFTVAGACLGALIVSALFSALVSFAARPTGSSADPVSVGIWPGLLIGGFVGYFAGCERAFWIRLKLHRLLCEVQIEENTRALRQHETAPPEQEAPSANGDHVILHDAESGEGIGKLTRAVWEGLIARLEHGPTGTGEAYYITRQSLRLLPALGEDDGLRRALEDALRTRLAILVRCDGE